MAILKLPVSRNQPPGRFAINWGHPLARDLRFLVASDGAGGFVEYVRNVVAVKTNTPVPQEQIMRSGLAPARTLKVSGTQYLRTPHDTSYNLLGDMSLLWSGMIASASAFRAFMSKCLNNGATNNPFDFRTDNAAAGSMQPVLAIEGVSYTSSASATLIPIGKPFMIGVAHALTDTFVTFSLNGNYISTTPSTTVTPTSTTDTLNIGRRADGGVQMVGNHEFAIGWARKLNADEMAALYRDPYQILIRQSKRIYYGAVAGGSTAKPWHYYAQQHRRA